MRVRRSPTDIKWRQNILSKRRACAKLPKRENAQLCSGKSQGLHVTRLLGTNKRLIYAFSSNLSSASLYRITRESKINESQASPSAGKAGAVTMIT